MLRDDAILGEAVRDHVTAVGHAVDWMKRLDDAGAARETVEYGLVLLDLRLPDGNGINFLRHMRTGGDTTPIIILTAHDQISDRIEGLNSGADDYLVKPFNLDELSARILAVSRRYAGTAQTVITIGPVSIRPGDRAVKIGTQDITLSSREWAVLDSLISRPSAIVAKSQIEESLYAFGSEIESNTVEVYVSRLRKKLGKGIVETVRGIGYRLGKDG